MYNKYFDLGLLRKIAVSHAWLRKNKPVQEQGMQSATPTKTMINNQEKWENHAKNRE